MSNELLPPNASQLVRDVIAANDIDIDDAVTTLATLKQNPPDQFLDWLIWEYGLEELAPYIQDKREAIKTGILWQRIKGTPRSLAMGLSWVGFDDAVFEQFSPGVNAPRYMISAGRIPQTDEIDDIIGVSRLSAPPATRLWRVWHDYDVRALKLSTHRIGSALLSDASGVRHNGVKLSFAERFSSQAKAPDIEVASAVTEKLAKTARYNPHQMLIGSFKLGDKAIARSGSGIFDLNSQQVSVNPTVSASVHRRFAQSHMTLSGGKLGTSRSYLGLRKISELGEPITLSKSKLGEFYQIEYVPIPVVSIEQELGQANYLAALSSQHAYTQVTATAVTNQPISDDSYTLVASASMSVRELGLQWVGNWDDRAWNTFEHITIGSNYRVDSS